MKMARRNDPFWDFVAKLDDGSFKCTFCGYIFAPATSVSRIKWHLSGVKGRGVRICDKVTRDIKDAARAAIDGPPEKKHKATAGSSNYNDANTISTSARDQNYEGRLEEMPQGEGFSPGVSENWIEQATVGEWERMLEGFPVVTEEQEQQPERGSSYVRPSIDQADEPQGDSSQPTNLLCLGHGRYDDHLFSPSENNDALMDDVQNMDREKTVEEEEDVENNSGRLAQPGAGASSSGVCKYNISETRGYPLPTTKLVGQAFEENKKVIWSFLMDDKVSTIGVYGMGGVGKTTMLKHVYNELLERPSFCNQAWWVTVSQDFSIKRLQNLIAKRLELDLSSEDDDLCRAVKLLKELREKQKWILILDDMWKAFELEKVGIPVPLKGCKLIMTTRSERVCQQMYSQRKIKVMPLAETEAWNLFMEKLGQDIALSPDVEQIAKDVARECAGLPLGIITLAGSLRGVDDREWRNTLKKLKESNFDDMEDNMEDKVFRILRFSYDRLNDLAIKQCLLYCALFPEDYEIERKELIGYLIDEGIIKGMGSWQDAFDEGHVILNKLENVCLLETCFTTDDDDDVDDGEEAVRMHDLIRDMAIQIQQENSQVIVKASAQLKELTDVEEWTQNLRRVSLMHNQINKICSRHSPRCPRLSTLLLQSKKRTLWQRSNEGLRFIAGSFFEHLHGLKVLDLSNTWIETLPASISNLVSLTALLLIDCKRLRKVPSLKRLKALKRLDLYRTTLKKMPKGMKCLTNLRYLRMNGFGEKEFPSGILPELSHLQVLVLGTWITDGINSQYFPVTLKQKEVACLKKLERLTCHLESHSEFLEFLKSRDEIQSLKTYQLSVGLFDEHDSLEMRKISCRSKTVGLGNLSINTDGDFQVMFPTDIQQLVIFECNDATSSCHVSSLIKYSIKLEVIKIRNCNMESLFSWFCSTPLLSPSYSLKVFRCHGCHSMKKLFPLVLLPNLVNLEVIEVCHCDEMEEIVGTRSDEEGVMGEKSSSNIKFNLPKLRILKLEYLPELKSICSEKLIWHSLERITVRRCHKLSMMLICPPLHKNGQQSLLPSLEIIRVSDCEKIEEVIGTRSDDKGVMGEKSSSFIEFNLPKLIALELRGLPELKSICSGKLICHSLERIIVRRCHKLKRVLSCPLLHENGQPSPLPSLEIITVYDCEKIEEVIGTRSDEEGVMGEKSSSIIEFNLPKLRFLYLQFLRELKSICSPKNGRPSPLPSLEVIVVFECEKMEETMGTRSYEERVMGEDGIGSAKLICNSIEEITVIGCEKLKRMPICLPLDENGQPSTPSSLARMTISSKEWWESVVEWEQPNAKDVFLPFVEFW